MWEVWTTEKRKAAKKHYCNMCGRTISKGEKYSHGKGLYDGLWSVWDECLHCNTMLIVWEDGITGGDGYEELDTENAVSGWVSDLSYSIDELRAKAGFKKKWRTAQGNLWPLPYVVPVLTAVQKTRVRDFKRRWGEAARRNMDGHRVEFAFLPYLQSIDKLQDEAEGLRDKARAAVANARVDKSEIERLKNELRTARRDAFYQAADRYRKLDPDEDGNNILVYLEEMAEEERIQ